MNSLRFKIFSISKIDFLLLLDYVMFLEGHITAESNIRGL